MVFVCGFFAVGLLVAALRWAHDKWDRAFYLGCCALNVIAMAVMISDQGRGAFKLLPSVKLTFLGY